ncbi:MAG: RNA methyltransferase [Planctomycetia bacterium]|nr:RNA methyltransferase [Planctomycetia bacterium]
MPDFMIESHDELRLDLYRDLKDAQPLDSGVFIAEGEKLVRRLLASPCRTKSILCTAAARTELADCIPPETPVYVATTAIIKRLVGFKFHRGVLAAGMPPANRTLQSILDQPATGCGRSLVVACPEIRDPANLGSIIRSAAAFGAACVVAGHRGTAPFSRRVLRTSMGAVLNLPIVLTDEWDCTVDLLHRHGYETIATVLDSNAEALANAALPERVAVLLGNEDSGLPNDLVARCQRRVGIPMADAGMSLNVAVAAGIVLNHFRPATTTRRL